MIKPAENLSAYDVIKIQLDAQQLKKAIKLYGNDIEEINFKPVIKIKDIYKPERILEQELKEIRKDK